MLGDEVVVIQVGVGGIHAVNLVCLALRQTLVRIQTTNRSEQPLSPKDLVDSGDTPRKPIGHIKESRVGVRDFDGTRVRL